MAFLYRLADEAQDRSINNRWDVWENFINSKDSWKNKYEDGLPAYEKKWYHFGIHPDYKEKFAFSSTFFVFLTDGEHLFQFLKNRFVDFAFAMISWWLALASFTGQMIGSQVKERLKWQ